MNRLKTACAACTFCILFAGCASGYVRQADVVLVPASGEKMEIETTGTIQIETEETFSVNAEGMTLETRIPAPAGYHRSKVEAQSFGAFVRSYALKPAGSPVLLFDGRKKGNQQAHEAVFAMHLEAEDFQQCADSVMRIYAEYLYETGKPNQIKFNLVNGFSFDFATWSQGNKLVVDNNKTTWGSNQANDGSKESLERYLHMLFAYASTLSMAEESAPVDLSDLQTGDIFIKGGSPGHVVMVADICENENGEKAFLLAQGYMPAQEFHILKNPGQETDPWYYTSKVTYPFETPEYTFTEGSLRRPPYLK